MNDNSATNDDIDLIIESEVDRHNEEQNASETMTYVAVTDVHATPTSNNSTANVEKATKNGMLIELQNCMSVACYQAIKHK